MDPLNKKEIGKRIKRLRKEKGLKQWQMADILGATQPAVHKYENGILPEVKRLLELARVGNTTVEWILTGRHWEYGSEERERIPPEIFRLAERFNRFTREQRQTILSALELLERASSRVQEHSGRRASDVDVQEIARTLRDFDTLTRQALIAALGLHDSIVESLADSKIREFRELSTSGLSGDSPVAEEAETESQPPVKLHEEIY